MSRFLVLYRGGDASKLSPKENEILSKKWSLYREKLVKAGALKEGGRVQSSAATQLVGKTREIKEKRVGNHASFRGRLLSAGRQEHESAPTTLEDVPSSDHDGRHY